MKRCPTCGKEFEDSMKFCQVDGTPLVDAEPAFDPYATMVGKQVAPGDEAPAERAFEPQPEEPSPIAEPSNVLEMPEADPLKTMYVSEAEMKEAFGQGEQEPVIEMPPVPEPPSFIAPEPSPPSFGDASPPPSPFSMPEPQAEEPAPSPPPFDEQPTVVAPSQFEPPPPAPVAEWTPPPAPDAAWQNEPIGSNTPFQPPPAGTGAQNKTLAIVSLICGIAGLTICCGGFIVNIAAIITGFMARSKASQSPQEFGGAGMALAGSILGIVGLIGSILIWVIYGGLILSSGGFR